MPIRSPETNATRGIAEEQLLTDAPMLAVEVADNT